MKKREGPQARILRDLEMRLLKLCLGCSVIIATFNCCIFNADAEIASVGYVTSKISNTVSDQSTNDQAASAAATYTFSSNANNLTSGTVAPARLPDATTSAKGAVMIGTTASTVAVGNDQRFDTVATTAPSGSPDTGRAFIWFQ